MIGRRQRLGKIDRSCRVGLSQMGGLALAATAGVGLPAGRLISVVARCQSKATVARRLQLIRPSVATSCIQVKQLLSFGRWILGAEKKSCQHIG